MKGPCSCWADHPESTELRDAKSVLARIAALHVEAEGYKRGYCRECETLWPCDTRRLAAGST